MVATKYSVAESSAQGFMYSGLRAIFWASTSVFVAFFGFSGGVSCVVTDGGSVTWWSGLTVEFNTAKYSFGERDIVS